MYDTVTNKVSLRLCLVMFNEWIDGPCKVAKWPATGFPNYWLLYRHPDIAVLGNNGRSNNPLLSQIQDSHEKEEESEESQVGVVLMERFGPRHELRDIFEQPIEEPHLHTQSAQIVRQPK